MRQVVISVLAAVAASTSHACADTLSWLKPGEYACFSESSTAFNSKTGQWGPWSDGEGRKMHPNFRLVIWMEGDITKAQISMLDLEATVYAWGNPDRDVYMSAIFGRTYSMILTPKLEFAYSSATFGDRGPHSLNLQGDCTRM